MGYAAYGFADEAWKGGASAEIMIGNMPQRKLNLTYKHDLLPLGAGSFGFGNGDVVTSILTKKGGRKMSMIDDIAVTYQHEWSQGFNMTTGLERRTIFPSVHVPMVGPDGTLFDYVGYDQALLQLRFSKDEIVSEIYSELRKQAQRRNTVSGDYTSSFEYMQYIRHTFCHTFCIRKIQKYDSLLLIYLTIHKCVNNNIAMKLLDLNLLRKLAAFFIGTQEHKAEEGKQYDSRRQSYGIDSAHERRADLIDDQRNRVGKAALVADRKPCPFRAVHLSRA